MFFQLYDWKLTAMFFQLYDRGFPSQSNTKNLDLSDKTDLDFWNCFGRSIPHLIKQFKKLS